MAKDEGQKNLDSLGSLSFALETFGKQAQEIANTFVLARQRLEESARSGVEMFEAVARAGERLSEQLAVSLGGVLESIRRQIPEEFKYEDGEINWYHCENKCRG